MNFPEMEKLKKWFKRFAIIMSIIVGLLSWISGVSYLLLIVRMSMAYIVMYAFTVGSLILFEKSALPDEKEDLRGAFFDIAVGIENEGTPGSKISKAGDDSGPEIGRFNNRDDMPGQIDSSLAEKIPDEEHQAKIVRRMGWDNTKTGGG